MTTADNLTAKQIFEVSDDDQVRRIALGKDPIWHTSSRHYRWTREQLAAQWNSMHKDA